jgi:hypothetical protein
MKPGSIYIGETVVLVFKQLQDTEAIEQSAGVCLLKQRWNFGCRLPGIWVQPSWQSTMLHFLKYWSSNLLSKQSNLSWERNKDYEATENKIYVLNYEENTFRIRYAEISSQFENRIEDELHWQNKALLHTCPIMQYRVWLSTPRHIWFGIVHIYYVSVV